MPTNPNANPAQVFTARPAVIFLLFILLVTVLWVVTDPLPQDLGYHNFADQRSWLSIPNALDVMTNIPYLVVGVWGFTVLAGSPTLEPGTRKQYLGIYAGIFFTGIGSAYYHWSPDNATLVWDRLPMTIAFMSFAALLVNERIDAALGSRIFPWLLGIGALSVFYWAWTDDLRPYALVQFGPMIVLPWLILRRPGPGNKWIWMILLFYLVAKLFEHFDHQVFSLTGEMISGHSLKHLSAAAAAAAMVMKLKSHLPPNSG